MINDNRLPLKTKFLEYYSELPVQKLAGESIGKSEDTITRWKQEDADFADQMMQAAATWAKRTSKGVRSKEWLLERVMKDHFAQRKELTGKDGGELKVSIRDYGVEKDGTQGDITTETTGSAESSEG